MVKKVRQNTDTVVRILPLCVRGVVKSTVCDWGLNLCLSLQAARDGREDVVRHWLNRGPESGRKAAINKRDEHGFTALHYAARFNRVRVIQTLVQNDAGELVWIVSTWV